MTLLNIVLIVGGIALAYFVVWPLVQKDLDLRTDEWLRDPKNVKKLDNIVNSKYAYSYAAGYGSEFYG